MNRHERKEILRAQGHTLIGDLAELIAGLQVPRSIDGKMLGTGKEAWDRIWGEHLNVFGWKNKHEVESALYAAIGEEVALALRYPAQQEEIPETRTIACYSCERPLPEIEGIAFCFFCGVAWPQTEGRGPEALALEPCANCNGLGHVYVKRRNPETGDVVSGMIRLECAICEGKKEMPAYINEAHKRAQVLDDLATLVASESGDHS